MGGRTKQGRPNQRSPTLKNAVFAYRDKMLYLGRDLPMVVNAECAAFSVTRIPSLGTASETADKCF